MLLPFKVTLVIPLLLPPLLAFWVVRAPGTSLMPPSHMPTTSQMSTDYETIWWQALNGYSTSVWCDFFFSLASLLLFIEVNS